MLSVRFLEIFLFDALIFNVDRHLGNFGYLIDNGTNAIIDVAPIFDNGYGLMPHLEVSARSAADNFYSIRNYLRDKRPALFHSWLDFPYEMDENILGRLAALDRFRFKKHRHYNWTDERRAVLSGFLQKRALEIRRFGRKADEYAEQSLVAASIIPNENVGVRSSSSSVLNTSEQMAARLILRDSAVTEETIANQLNVTLRQAERIIAELKRKAGLKRRGSDKAGEWYFEQI